MAKNDPESVEAGAGLIMSVATKLNRAILKRTGGKGGVFHRLSTPDGDSIIEQMADAAVGLINLAVRIFTSLVDKNDPALQPFNRDEFSYVESGLKPEHYPLKGTGIQERHFKVINLWERFDHDPTTQELLDLVKAEGEDPDFADTKAFLRDNPGEATNEHPLISLCGSVVRRDGCRDVAYFIAFSSLRSLHWYRLALQWPRYCRLLVAC